MVSKLPQMSLAAIYPPPFQGLNLNTCPDPDCPNHGVAPDPVLLNAPPNLRREMALQDPAVAAGRGNYKAVSSTYENLLRVSGVFEFEGEPVGWTDNRNLQCLHRRGNDVCGSGLNLLSNEHLEVERRRLDDMNGLLAGPSCGACGKRYLEAPEEFALNGANGKAKTGDRVAAGKALGIRLVHKPCKGKKGARFTVSAPHRRQKDTRENLRILREVVNKGGFNILRRTLTSPETGKAPGMGQIYKRLFWLESVLLAYERAQLEEWRKKREREGLRHTRIAHDDIVLGVNWETRKDRRITQLNCSVSSDIQSGYVFRADIDFDPTVDPVETLAQAYLGADGSEPALRAHYTQKSGRQFTAPRLAFQRPTGRYDEAALFAAADLHLALACSKIRQGFEKCGIVIDAKAYQAIQEAERMRAELRVIGQGWFGLREPERDGRNSFSGIMTRSTYTKAAHFLCLRDMLPAGRMTVVGEQEASMARVLPHLFREDIAAGLFEWHVVHFDKNATKDEITRRTREFELSLKAFQEANPDLSRREAMLRWAEPRLKAATRFDGHTHAPFPISNFQTRAFPSLWLRSPVQTSKETNMVVGFPILRPGLREEYKRFRMDELLPAGPLSEAITRRVADATLHPTSTFMNSLRQRLTFTERSGGGGSARSPDSYVNGSCYNPRVLIAVVNIFRVWYNFFEMRSYVRTTNRDTATVQTQGGTRMIRVPGQAQPVQVPRPPRRKTIHMTPAMRLGIHEPKEMAPNPARILYQPWLLHGTPLWDRLKN